MEFRKRLAEGLASGPKGDVEEDWCTFKESLQSAQRCLPLISEREDEDWVTDELREVAKKKQEAWMRWVKSSHVENLKQEYRRLKLQSRQCADKARDRSWH